MSFEEKGNGQKSSPSDNDRIGSMIRNITVGVAVAALVAIPSYIFSIRKNQNDIEYIKTDLQEIKKIVEVMRENASDYKDDLYATNLFVAQAHPDRDVTILASIEKLKKLKREEIYTLAKFIAQTGIPHDESSPNPKEPGAMRFLTSISMIGAIPVDPNYKKGKLSADIEVLVKNII